MGVRSSHQESAPIQSPYYIAQTVPQRCSDPLLAMVWPPLWSPSVQAMLSEVLRAGPEPTPGLSHLSTPDSILMSCQALYNLTCLRVTRIINKYGL